MKRIIKIIKHDGTVLIDVPDVKSIGIDVHGKRVFKFNIDMDEGGLYNLEKTFSRLKRYEKKVRKP